jgi:valyl-tRNA synthetase
VISAINSLDGEPATAGGTSSASDWSLADSWIWARLEQLIRDVDRLFETFQYGQAGQLIFDFFWGEFADWYVEAAKQQLKAAASKPGPAQRTALTLARVLDASLRLLHPFTPFVTEELWGHLRTALLDSPLADLAREWPEMLIAASWPEPRLPEGWEAQKLADFTLVQDIVRAIRNVRAEKAVKPGRRIPAAISGGYKAAVLNEQLPTLVALSGLDAGAVEIAEAVEKPAESLTLVVGPVEIHLPLAGLVDPDAERDRLGRELAEAQDQVTRLEKLLASDFASKAPPALVQKEREKLAAYRETAAKIRAQLR